MAKESIHYEEKDKSLVTVPERGPGNGSERFGFGKKIFGRARHFYAKHCRAHVTPVTLLELAYQILQKKWDRELAERVKSISVTQECELKDSKERHKQVVKNQQEMLTILKAIEENSKNKYARNIKPSKIISASEAESEDTFLTSLLIGVGLTALCLIWGADLKS